MADEYRKPWDAMSPLWRALTEYAFRTFKSVLDEHPVHVTAEWFRNEPFQAPSQSPSILEPLGCQMHELRHVVVYLGRNKQRIIEVDAPDCEKTWACVIKVVGPNDGWLAMPTDDPSRHKKLVWSAGEKFVRFVVGRGEFGFTDRSNA